MMQITSARLQTAATNMDVFGLWEENGVPGENSHNGEENMQILHRKAGAKDGTWNPWNCDSDKLTTVPPCSPICHFMFYR